MPELPELVKLLTHDDCLMIKFLCYPSMRGMPRLVRMRYGARAAGLRNRVIAGPNARRLEFARWEYRRGLRAEWTVS